MRKVLGIAILTIGISSISYCQDFKFKWKINPSTRIGFVVQIERKNSIGYINIKEMYSKDSLITRITNKECDLLMAFLDKYDFRDKQKSVFNRTIVRNYVDVTILPDTNRVVLNRDTINKAILSSGYELKFDKKQNKWYSEAISAKIYTDGVTYSGEYEKLNTKNKYCIYDTEENMSSSDKQLNKIICGLIEKYDKKGKRIILKRYMLPNK